MPVRMDGSGRCRIQASERVFRELHLDELPFGNGRSLEDGPGTVHITRSPGALKGRNKSYRVRMERPDGWTHKADPTLSFQLSSAHVNETLYFLAEFWRMKGVPFQRITNEYGNGYDMAGLQGGSFFRKNS